jgi:L-lactate dehydrogenase complex protein LldG
MSARDDILATVRRSLGASVSDTARRASVDARIAAAAPGLRPARGQGDAQTRAQTFIEEAQRVNATVERVAAADDVPEAAARYLRERNLAATLRMGEDARLASMPWAATQIEISAGASAGDDPNAISFAEAGVAETGTLVFVSGAHNPTTLNFLADNHIAVVRASAIEADYEAVWALLRARFGKGLLPRTVNFVTGPSRSADIEQKMLLGAHGPRSLHVILLDE